MVAPKICSHSKRITISSVVFTSVATLLFWLAIFLIIMRPGFFSYIGALSGFILNKTTPITDPNMLINLGRMVSDGTLIGVNDLWSFQTYFYQTIITVLVAINGILGAFAFFIIRNSSNAKAREEAINEVNVYTESIHFHGLVKEKINEKVDLTIHESIDALQVDLRGQLNEFDAISEEISSIDELRRSLEKQLKEINEMKRHIALIALNVAARDAVDNEGSSLILENKEI